MTQMTSRERVRTTINHEEPDRVPVRDGPWWATIERWKTEGFPEDVEVHDYFDYDLRGLGADTSPRLPEETLSEDEEYITTTTSWGQTRRNHRDRSTTPEIIDCAVKTKDDWLKLKKRLTLSEDRVNWEDVKKMYAQWRDEERYITYNSAAGYDQAQGIIRSELLLTLMASDPEFIQDVIMTIAHMVAGMYEIMVDKGFEFDGVFTYNDMGYRNASLFSPAMYRDIVRPGDMHIWETAHKRGAQTIMHSCGRVSALIPDMIDGGLDCLQALEVKAGMDTIAIKEEHGDKLALFGGIDTRCLEHPDPTKIEEELRTKFTALKPGGGYIYQTDHSVPHDVSFERYCYNMFLVRKYGEY